jgi:hypothetical protein
MCLRPPPNRNASNKGMCGTMSKDALDRLRNYILARLDETVDVGALAELARPSPFHFTRVFARLV